MSNRPSLEMPSFDAADLDDFAPRPKAPKPAEALAEPAAARRAPKADKRAIDAVSRFPSREGPTEGQLNLKGPLPILERFRAMCKEDRRAYYDMLEILMDRYEGTKG